MQNRARLEQICMQLLKASICAVFRNVRSFVRRINLIMYLSAAREYQLQHYTKRTTGAKSSEMAASIIGNGVESHQCTTLN